MKVFVKIHGYLESYFAESAFEIGDLHEGATVGDLLKAVWKRYARPGTDLPSLEEEAMQQEVLVAVNSRLASPGRGLKDGDAVDLLPPAVGG